MRLFIRIKHQQKLDISIIPYVLFLKEGKKLFKSILISSSNCSEQMFQVALFHFGPSFDVI